MTATAIAASRPSRREVRFNGSLFNDRLDWLVGGFYSKEKLQLVDNSKFGTQYGAFAACRSVATIFGANPVLRNPARAGCLSPTGRATLNSTFGLRAPTIAAGFDRLSTLNDLGSVRDVYNQDSENYAFFTHNIIKLTDRLSVTLGARYTHERKVFDANFNNNNTVCPLQQTNLSPLLGNPALAGTAGLLVTLSCTGNSSTGLNALALTAASRRVNLPGLRSFRGSRSTNCWSMAAMRRATRRAASTSIARRSAAPPASSRRAKTAMPRA